LCSKEESGFVSVETVCNQDTTYMSNIPTDPIVGQEYTYAGAAQGYDISFTTEKESVYGLAGVFHWHSENIDNSAGNR